MNGGLYEWRLRAFAKEKNGGPCRVAVPNQFEFLKNIPWPIAFNEIAPADVRSQCHIASHSSDIYILDRPVW